MCIASAGVLAFRRLLLSIDIILDWRKITFLLFYCTLYTLPGMNDMFNEPPHDKTNKMTVHPVKTQISLGIRPV